MRELTFVSVASDGQRILLTDEDGGEYALMVSPAVRQAINPQVAKPQPQPTAPNDGPVSPRDVQQRLRHGASVEDVATEAGMDIDRVQSYAVPVMQERSFVAERAQSCEVPGGETLGEAVATRLRSRGILTEPSWDSWRQFDGTWTVIARFGTDQSSASMSEETGTFEFDPRAKKVTPEDDTARWLINADQHAEQAAEETGESEEQAADVEALANIASEIAPEESHLELSPQPQTELPTEVADSATDQGGRPLSRRAARRRARRKAQRREPTWDEILFGDPQPNDGDSQPPRS